MKRRSARSHNRGKVLRKYLGYKTYEYPNERKLAALQSLFFLGITVTACLSAAAYGKLIQPSELVSPLPVQATTQILEVEKEVVIDKNQNIDTWIGEAVDEFLPKRKSEARMIMHCLAFREAHHGELGKPEDKHGDGGLAGGPFQFHEATWNRMRNQMIQKGLAEGIGSRYDFKESARTTAWALANGRASEWGPIYRALKGINKNTCPIPSWHKK